MFVQLATDWMKAMGRARLFSQRAVEFFALMLLAGCTAAPKVAEFKHQNGGLISVDVTKKTITLVDKTYPLKDCSNAQFTCYVANGYAVAFPKKCRPLPEVDDVINFNASFGYEHIRFLPHKTGYSRIHGPASGLRNFLFEFDLPRITHIYFSKTTDLASFVRDDNLAEGELDVYDYAHVESSYTLGCSPS